MMRKQAISVDYKPLKDADLLVLAQNLASALDGSTLYPKPAPDVAAYQGLIADFSKAIQLLATRVVGAKDVRDHARRALEDATAQWSQYATVTTPDRPDLWGITGFPLTKAETTRPLAPGKGQNLRLTDGPEAGSLHAELDRVPNMLAYVWRIWPEGTTPGLFGYHTLISREPQIAIPGLSSRQTYCVQGAPWNNTGEPQFSDAATRTVQ